MSHSNLYVYYQKIFGMAQHHKYSITEIENLIPYERDLYFEMILELPDKNINSVRDNLKGRYRVIEFVSANDAYK